MTTPSPQNAPLGPAPPGATDAGPCPDLPPTVQLPSAAPEPSSTLPAPPPAQPGAGTLLTTGPTAAVPPTPAERVNLPGYEILSELGRGGMGVVYKARHITLKRIVALKCVLAGCHAGAADLARLRTEAEAVACLQHPNVVHIYEIGEHEGQPYLALEFCGGGSLAARLDGTPWPPDRAAGLVVTLALAVHAAHQKGVIHRDLKPANVLLADPAGHEDGDPLGEPKITDFGLAKKVHDVSQTQSGSVMGTPSYMSPEQASGKNKEVGPAADVYALGAILYELLTGRPPFKAPTAVETILQVLGHDPVSPRKLQPRCPTDLETVCNKCLQKEPGKRYASAQELADDLERFLRGEPIRARPTPLWERGLKWARRRPATAALVGVCLLAVLALLAGLRLYDRRVRADRAAALVRSLGSAEAGQVPRLIEDLDPYRPWADPLLRELAGAEGANPAVRLRASLALAPVDPGQVPYLSRRLLDCPLHDFPLVRDSLRPYREELIAPLRAALRDQRRSPTARFRAGLALADYDPDGGDWEESDLTFLAGQLLEAGRDDQRDLRRYLHPLGDRLLDPLEARFRDPRARTTVQLLAADALADFARDDPRRLALLASAASPEQYDVLKAALLAVRDRDLARRTLLAVLGEQPASRMDGPGRVALGRRRAGAAITLLHLGEGPAACDVFRVSTDPETLTQFVHRLRERRLGPRELLDCLGRAGDDARVRFGLLLALGEFRLEEMPAPSRQALVARLCTWYDGDPHSSVHGACGWLLRTWGLGAEAARVDRTPRSCDPTGRRDWFVERVGDDYFTFVAFRPGTFEMGSPRSEAYRHPNERRHRVRLTRPFALCDRELTAGQFARFLKATGLPPPHGDEPEPHPDLPVVQVTWPEAVLYCRWLSQQAGLDESRQAHALAPGEGTPEARVEDGPFRPERPGFRLPTEAEWERACRAGTVTAYGFGNDRDLLAHYGRFLETGPAVGGMLRPNLGGLYDMHGNVWEWCHDRYRRVLPDAVDPVGAAAGKNRVLRGGGWDRSAWHCRSAYRHSPTPDYRGAYMGFRLARTLPAPEGTATDRPRRPD